MKAATIGQRGICRTCHGAKRMVCSACKGTKESAYHGTDICELCDDDGMTTCGTCKETGLENPTSFEQVVAWYDQGHRDFTVSDLGRPGRTSYIGRSLQGIRLPWARLAGFQFVNVDFTGADLTGANLEKAILSRCVFAGGTTLQRSNLVGAQLDHAKLSGADLEGADLTGANLEAADLKDARLNGANLTGVNLRNLSLERADLRRVTGLKLDANYIAGARFSPGASDLWSTLRRQYTGPMFAFHFLILVCFLAPYVLRTLYWVTVNRAQVVTAEAASQITAKLETSGAADPAYRQAVEIAVSAIKDFKPCLYPTCEEFPIWKLLLGLDRGWLAALPIALIVYNVCRGILTWRVSLLRAEEERSGYSPAHKSYAWLYWLHIIFQVLLIAAVTSLVWHAWEWSNLVVWLPNRPA